MAKSRPAAARRGDAWRHRSVLLLLVILGVGITVWPVGETIVNDQQATTLTTTYTKAIEARAPELLSHDLQVAREYNAQLQPGALNDPWNVEVRTSNEAHTRYLSTLGDLESVLPEIPSLRPLARVRVPTINVDLPVFHDADKLTLAHGIGHMYGSSLPAGGPDTHAVLAGHTGLKGRTMFDRLPETSPGQEFFVDVAGETLTYRIDQILVVEPWELEAVARVPGGDYVTLVTCYTPPGEHRQRMLVRGVRVPTGGATTTQTTTTVTSQTFPTWVTTAASSVQTWMWPRIAIGLVALLALVALGFRWRRTDRAEAANALRTALADDPSNEPVPARGEH